MSKYTTPYIIPETCGVTNSERVRALDGYFARFTAIQLSHALHFCECDEIAILKTVASLI